MDTNGAQLPTEKDPSDQAKNFSFCLPRHHFQMQLARNSQEGRHVEEMGLFRRLLCLI